MTHSQAGAQSLIDLGATVAFADALDGPAVEEAVRRFQAEIIIDELTALPKDPANYPAAFEGDRKLRQEGGGNLLRAAQACGVRRYIQQASGFFLKGGGGLADESSSLATDASPGVAASAQSYAHLEARLLSSSGNIEGVILRYGFFYGPNTWYSPDGAAADHVRRRERQSSGAARRYGPSSI
jgi:nucleoside-diphosphate-sugar epimerase